MKLICQEFNLLIFNMIYFLNDLNQKIFQIFLIYWISMNIYLVYSKYKNILNFDLNNDYEDYIHDDLSRGQFNLFD